MNRVDDPTALPDLFGPGKAGFTNGDPKLKGSASILPAEWLNGVQEELVAGILEHAGLTPDAGDNTQVRQALDVLYGTERIFYEFSDVLFGGVKFDVGAQTTNPLAVRFGDSGSKMYVGDLFSVDQFDVATPYDLKTAVSAEKTGSWSAQSGNNDFFFKPDGTKVYGLASTDGNVAQYTLTTPWDISTITDDAVALDVSGQDTTPQGLWISPDGTKLFVAGSSNDSVYRYTLSTPWDLSTASFDPGQVLAIGPDPVGTPRGLALSPDGTRLFSVDNAAPDGVAQWFLSTAFDLTTAFYTGIFADLSGIDGSLSGLDFSANGARAYVCGNTDNAIIELHTTKVVGAL